MITQRRALILALALGFGGAIAAVAQDAPVNSALFSDMRWREIGPMRAGRTRALAGVPSQPATFYLGAVNGGVWKTTDAGDTWHSIWDNQPTGSIGTIAVSLSDPDIIYVGSGEGLAAARSLHRRRRLQIHRRRQNLDPPRSSRRPADRPDRHRSRTTLTASSLPSPATPTAPTKSAASTDRRMAARPSRTSSSSTTSPAHPKSRSIPTTPNVVYAGMWERQEGAWENGAWSGTQGGLFKSTDGGDHWTKTHRRWSARRHPAGERDHLTHRLEPHLHRSGYRTRRRPLSLRRWRRDLGPCAGQRHAARGAHWRR